jgi:hypothetical protein
MSEQTGRAVEVDEEAIRRDERRRVAALLTDNASIFDDYETAEALRKALAVLLTLGPAVPESAETDGPCVHEGGQRPCVGPCTYLRAPGPAEASS